MWIYRLYLVMSLLCKLCDKSCKDFENENYLNLKKKKNWWQNSTLNTTIMEKMYTRYWKRGGEKMLICVIPTFLKMKQRQCYLNLLCNLSNVFIDINGIVKSLLYDSHIIQTRLFLTNLHELRIKLLKSLNVQ